MLALPLVGLIGLAINFHYARLIETQLFAASSAAAHAGANELCLSEQCWETARDLAIETLKRHSVARGLAGSVVLDVSSIDGGPVWELSGARVGIERGFWSESSGFISLEEHSGDVGIRKLAANSVRVRVEASSVEAMLNPYGVSRFNISQSTIGTLAESKSYCAAPFAIPACALLDDNGRFQEQAVWDADRIFTKVSRYCSDADNDPDCGIVPGFQYAAWQPAGLAQAPNEILCLWRDDKYTHAADYFGVVGLPGEYGVVDEEDVTRVLNSTSGDCGKGSITTFLGQTYSILPEGLTQAQTEQIVWDRIVASDAEDLPGEHPAYSAVLEGPRHLSEMPNMQYSLIGTVECSSLRNMKGELGACNSRRYSWHKRTIPGSTLTQCVLPSYQVGVDANTPVWRTFVSVIADLGTEAPACAGVDDNSQDPRIDPDRSWTVIGFLEFLIYDVDIGTSPMSPPHYICDGIERTAAGSMTLADLQKLVRMLPWGFGTNISGSSLLGNCDVVRGRVMKNASLDPTKIMRARTVVSLLPSTS